MGVGTKATQTQMEDHAVSSKLNVNYSMTAAIALLDAKRNRYSEYRLNFWEKPVGGHVEQRLFDLLLNDYAGGEKLPNDSRIILTCNWSPCTFCTEQTVPKFMDKIVALKREIRLKMRYRFIWCAKEASGDNLFDTSDNAKKAYKLLCAAYKSRIVEKRKQIEWVHEASASVMEARLVEEPYLVIENLAVKKTGTVLKTETWVDYV